MSSNIKKNMIVKIKKGLSVVNEKGQKTEINRELEGFDINDETVHTISIEALVMEYWEYYPEYNDIIVSRFVIENPDTFLIMKYPVMSGFSIPKDIEEKLQTLTGEKEDLTALNAAIIKSPHRFLELFPKVFPEFVEQHKEAAINSLAKNDGSMFLISNYRESHPHLIKPAIDHCVIKQPFSLALHANDFIKEFPAEVMKAIETIASNNYDLYVEEFSGQYPQFLIQ